MRLQRKAPLTAGFATRDAQIDQFAIAEQAHAARAFLEQAPAEAAFVDEDVALDKSGGTRGATDPVGGLDDKKVLVPGDDVKRRERSPQVGLEILASQLHAAYCSGLMASMRLRICCTASACMSATRLLIWLFSARTALLFDRISRVKVSWTGGM